MTYRIAWKCIPTDHLYIEYGDITKVKYLVEWLDDHSKDYELVEVSIDD